MVDKTRDISLNGCRYRQIVGSHLTCQYTYIIFVSCALGRGRCQLSFKTFRTLNLNVTHTKIKFYQVFLKSEEA